MDPLVKLCIENYRQPWESDEHWVLRREFIEYYHDKFPHDELLCLAQEYANIELSSCSYPPFVIRRNHELAMNLREKKGLQQYQNKQMQSQFAPSGQHSFCNNDQHSFYSSGQHSFYSSGPKRPTDFEIQAMPSKHFKTEDSRFDCSYIDPVVNNFSETSKDVPFVPFSKMSKANKKKPKKEGKKSFKELRNESKSNAAIIFILPNLRYKFVIMDNSEVRNSSKATHILANSAAFWGVNCSYKFEDCPSPANAEKQISCSVFLFHRRVGRANGIDQEKVKLLAAENALMNLKRVVFTAKVKKEDNAVIINRSDLLGKASSAGSCENWNEEIPLSSSSSPKAKRQFGKCMKRLLEDYKLSNACHNLIFPLEFSGIEMKKIHNIASKLQLKNHARDRGGDNPRMVVGKKFTADGFVQFLKDAGGSNEMYELIGPNSTIV